MNRQVLLLGALLGLLASGCGGSMTASAGRLNLKPIGGFDQPLQVEDTGDGVLWVVEKSGRIQAVRNGQRQGAVLDLHKEVSDGGEQGLLGVAVAPDFKQSGKAYLYMTNREGNSELREYTGSAEKLNPKSKRVLLKQDQPEANHNGGGLRFGPDGMLYLGLGDGGGGGDQHGTRGNAQNRQVLLGKILRINPAGTPYSIPKGNPFTGGVDRPEIWAYGLRNPWRFSFDRKGRLWIGDVGQDQYEEIDRLQAGQAGANLGWRVYEGNSRYTEGEEAPGAVKPLHTYAHQGGRCSVVGGIVSEGPVLKGKYLYGDTCDGKLRYLQSGKERKSGLSVKSLVSIDQDRKGQVYLSSLAGTVYLLEAK